METVTGTEVVNVVKLELRDVEEWEVALTGRGTADDVCPAVDGVEVATDEEDVGEGVAEDDEGGYEPV